MIHSTQCNVLHYVATTGKEDTTVACEWGRSTAAQLTLHDSVDVRFQARDRGKSGKTEKSRTAQAGRGGVVVWCGMVYGDVWSCDICCLVIPPRHLVCRIVPCCSHTSLCCMMHTTWTSSVTRLVRLDGSNSESLQAVGRGGYSVSVP